MISELKYGKIPTGRIGKEHGIVSNVCVAKRWVEVVRRLVVSEKLASKVIKEMSKD